LGRQIVMDSGQRWGAPASFVINGVLDIKPTRATDRFKHVRSGATVPHFKTWPQFPMLQCALEFWSAWVLLRFGCFNGQRSAGNIWL
jgi:hypothetical protein